MHIAITVDPYLPVPPPYYGGIERIIDLLVRELTARGHQVTLFAHPDSRTSARLIPYGRPPHTGWLARGAELAQVGGGLWWRQKEFDVVHSFGRLAALLPVFPSRHLPKIQSYQRDVPWSSVRRAIRLAGPSLTFTACSSSAYRLRPEGKRNGEWHTIVNGVDATRYTLQPSVAADAPLVFLGRLDPIKGAHNAIAIARGAGRRLVLAGTKITEGANARYFDEQIAPHLDGTTVAYIGPVDDTAKNRLLGEAAALVMAIEWEEPFGIVMAEAFACGTPVIAFARGSVPDVVRNGVNGFVCGTVGEAVAAVHALATIDRAGVRADCDARFSAPVIVDRYESLYRLMLDRMGRGASARALA